MQNNKNVVNKIIKSTLINVDSTYRNIYPKHIYKSDGRILDSNPLIFTKDSNIIKINYNNHGLKNGDLIIMQNVTGISKTIVNSFYLLNKFKYMIIIFNDNMIDSNYKDYIDRLNINIELYGEQTIKNMINNIPLNSILGIKKVLNANDIPLLSLSNSTIDKIITPIFNDYNIDILNKNVIFIELPLEYINENQPILQINQVFKLSYLHIGGIPLGYLNANYPINNTNYQSQHEIYKVIDSNNFEIMIKYKSFMDITGGGKYIQIMKILNSIIGYPDSNDYVINLKKSFNNVINIELISTEFPYVDLIIRKGINDKLYWKNIDDGNYIYNIIIDEGTYTTNTLLNKLLYYLNNTPLVSSINSNLDFVIYNLFEISFEPNNQKIVFTPYKQSSLPNSLSIRTELLDNNYYYILTVNHKNNLVSVNDIVTIIGSTNVTMKIEKNNKTQIFSFSASYINTNHKVYSIDLSNETYDIILGLRDNIFTELVEVESRGDQNIKVKTKTKVSFLFDRKDTLGEIIGFKNVGEENSITEFSTSISNKDNYVNAINLDTVGNELTYNSGFINLSGRYNYFLMYLNDIEFVYSNSNLPSAFAKIQLSGNPGDILFNTFVKQPDDIYSKAFPISNLTELSLKFFYPDGNKVEFRNTNHSFTIRIIEEQVQNEETYLNSQRITFQDQLVKR